MIDVVNLQAVVDEYQRKTKSRRMTSGERRVSITAKRGKTTKRAKTLTVVFL